jgi:small subunit ribosomal protein S20
LTFQNLFGILLAFNSQKGVFPLPQRRCAIKALRQNKVRHHHNQVIKNDLKKTIKKFLVAIKDKNKTEAEADLKLIHKKFDKLAKRHLLHANTVSRRKSRFSRILKSLAA